MLLPLLLALQVSAPAPPAIPIAVVDMPRLVSESIAGKAATARLDALRTAKEKAITAKNAALQVLTVNGAPNATIERERIALQRLGQDADVEVGALNQQLQKEFAAKVNPILKRIAEEDHFGFIMQSPQPLIAWADPAVDITTKVVQRLDALEKPKP